MLYFMGDSAETAPTLNVNLWDPVVTGDWWLWRDPRFLEQLSTEFKSRRGAGRFES